MKVSEWIRTHPGNAVTVSPDLTLDELLDRLLREPCLRDLYVLEEGVRLAGHISHKRIALLVLTLHRPSRTRRQIMEHVAGGSARELMDTHFPTARVDEELDEVLHRQLEHDIEDMPVVAEDGALLGAVNLSGVLQAASRGELDDD
jgi:CBS domain-containing protein